MKCPSCRRKWTYVKPANRFYEHIEDQKAAVSEYLDNRFGRWIDGGLCYDT